MIALTDNRLYGLFNNAGYGVSRPATDHQPPADGAAVFRQLFGVHQLTMLLLPAMEPHGEGRCDDLIGDGELSPAPARRLAASKFALEAWSDALRMELRHSGIKVILIGGPDPTRFTNNVSQTQTDKPVENPGIAAALLSGRKRWWKKCAMLLSAINRSCATGSLWWRMRSPC